MADPEIPEVRAELQRQGAGDRKQVSLGALSWLFMAFAATVMVIIIIAYAFS